MSSDPSLVLASASPRRAAILTRLGLTFEVLPSRVPEEVLEGEGAEDHARRLAVEKVEEVRGLRPGALVLGGDTVVVLGEEILGKPADADEAVAMLLRLGGRTHRVVSGLALGLPDGSLRAGTATTRVTFRPLDEFLARRYAETGEPLDKAGSYGIQGLGGALVEEVRGDYHTVVGLPLPLFLDLLHEGGWRYAFGTIVPLASSSGPLRRSGPSP